MHAQGKKLNSTENLKWKAQFPTPPFLTLVPFPRGNTFDSFYF